MNTVEELEVDVRVSGVLSAGEMNHFENNFTGEAEDQPSILHVIFRTDSANL